MTDAAESDPESLADRQLADARRDPRLVHSREAVIADWWAAMRAAERVRTLADWGLTELLEAEAHEERRLAAGGHTDANDPHRRPALEGARERAEMARAERENQLVEHNAMTLISMVSALDALIEGLAPRARHMFVEQQIGLLLQQARAREPEEAAQLDEAALEAIRHAIRQYLHEQLGDLDASPRGTGAQRWEKVLRHVGLQAATERAIPDDLGQALTEVVELRHVLAHRAGRVDDRALKKAPSLRYGDLVRVTHAEYLIYSAAIWTYGQEVIRRQLGDLAPAAPPLANWRQNYTLNA